MSPAPTAKARPSPSCARCWKPRASACTSIPRRIWCASTSASGSAAGAGVLVTDAELGATLEECERVNAGAPITVFEITTAVGTVAVRAPSGRRAAAGSRSRRPARRHQCDRPSARHRHHAGFPSITPIFSATRIEKIAAEKAGILKRDTPAIVAAQPRDALAVIERQAARLERAAENRRRGLDRDRGTRPAGLSGRGGPARSAGAEALRPPSVRECRAWRSRRCARSSR